MAPRLSVAQFVRTIVRIELASGAGPLESDAAQRITKRLHDTLVKLIGPAGFDVLLARALVLARRAHPILAGVVAGPGGSLQGLDDAARGGVALQEGAVAIVCNFMELLVALISEDLAMRLVRDAWPAAEDAKQ
jgi:hypothetical protein